MPKKKVVFVARHNCIRSIKQAVCLRDKFALHLVSEKLSQFSDVAFKTLTQFPSLDHLYDSLRLHGDADLFHVHNEPSFYVQAIKELFPDKPVILDLHDTMLSRWTQEQIEADETGEIFRHSMDERTNLHLADGIIFVCDPHARQVFEAYPELFQKPHAVTYSAVPEMFYRIDFGKWLGGVCYEGRIDAPGALNEGKKWEFFKYADYRDAAKQFTEAGIPFKIYTPRQNEIIRRLYNEFCFVEQPLRFDQMIRAIGSHDWGLVGNVFPHPQWDIAIPNKLFENQAAMLPTLAINARECSKFLEDTGFGITVESIDELKERWDELHECRQKLVKGRMAHTMERYIHNTERVYADLGVTS